MVENLPAKWEPRAPQTRDQYELVILAREMAMGVYPIPTILARHGLTDSEYQTIRQTPFFAKVLENEQRAWESVLNTENRTKLKAAAIFEDLMPEVYVRLKNGSEHIKDVIEGSKLMAKVAGIGERSVETNAGEKFAITINLGEDQKLHFGKDVTPSVVVPGESQGMGLPVRQLPEGEGTPPSIRSDPEGS